MPEVVKTTVNEDDNHDDESIDEDYKEHLLENSEKNPNHYSPVIWMIVIGEETYWPAHNILCLHDTNLSSRVVYLV